MVSNEGNTFANETCNSPWPSCLSLSAAVVTIAFMLIVMLGIVLGNLLVVLTVHNDSKLRSQRQNWLIVSLAIADLLVGLLVMPLTMAYEIIGEWRLGNVLCELWLALDVLFVTASILHICVISLDRYWSVTQPLSYPSRRTPLRISIMIGISWLVSLLICLPPILGWRPNRAPGECSVSTDIGYVLYSALGSFYIPVIILVIVYARIFVITKRHNRQRLKETERMGKTLCQLAASAARSDTNSATIHEASEAISKVSPDAASNMPLNGCCSSAEETMLQNCWNNVEYRRISTQFDPESTTAFLITASNNNAVRDKSKNFIRSSCFELTLHKNSGFKKDAKAKDDDGVSKTPNDKRRKLLKAKERQATLLLGLILSAFIVSWLPFFAMYVLGAFGYEAPTLVFKFFFWLGYCNSGINPVIYTVFNREFKCALCRQLKRPRKYFTTIVERLT
ncbi:Octopamine receptor [Toxocara canis]|uniref:Octopamine receptor n=1 Tax=Toxocara canis TaxID=6265 RepID=A0A0B2V825_TOXCA|nr:Octopamine receptor [Toxocara canis]